MYQTVNSAVISDRGLAPGTFPARPTKLHEMALDPDLP